MINGYRFHVKDREINRRTQNSGIALTAKISSYASARDQNPISGDVTYYGIITDIIELNYYEQFKVVLFKCDWVDVHSRGKGMKKDDYGFTLVNFNKLLYTGNQLSDEPFVLAFQVNQVFYVQDASNKDWKVVVQIRPRDMFDMQQEVLEDDIEVHMDYGTSENTMNNIEGELSWNRNDVPGLTIDSYVINTHDLEANAYDNVDTEDDYDLDDSNLL